MATVARGGDGDRGMTVRGTTKAAGRRPPAGNAGRSGLVQSGKGWEGKMVGAIGFEPTTPTMSR